MTGAEFRIIKEYVGVSAKWVADYFKVTESAVDSWDSERYPIPQNVEDFLVSLDELLEGECKKSVKPFVGMEQEKNKKNVVLINYLTDEDLWYFYPGFSQLKLPHTCYSALLGRLRRTLIDVGFNVIAVHMKKNEYLSWLDEEKDTPPLRAEWGAREFLRIKNSCACNGDL